MSPSKNKPLKKGLWKNISPGAYFLNFTVALQWIFTSSTNIADWLMPRMINLLAVDCLWKCFPPLFFFQWCYTVLITLAKTTGHAMSILIITLVTVYQVLREISVKVRISVFLVKYHMILSGLGCWLYCGTILVFVFSPTIISYSYISYVWENLFFRDRSLLRWAV